MKKIKTFEGFLSGIFGRREEERPEETSQEPKDISYEEASDKLLNSFDDIRATHHYFEILKSMGREKEFLDSEKGKRFIELRNQMNRR